MYIERFVMYNSDDRHAYKAIHIPRYVHIKVRGGQKLETYNGLEDLMP